MSRLYDRLLRWKGLPEELIADGLRDGRMIVIAADNVAEYFFAGTDKVDWDFDDFPNIAPPFDRFFVEFRAPSGILQPDTGMIPFEACYAWGIDFGVKEAHEDGWSVEFWGVAETWRNEFSVLFHGAVVINRDGSVFVLPDDDSTSTVPASARGQPALFLDLSFTADHDATMEGLWPFMAPAFLAISFMHCKNVTVRQERPPDWQQKAAVKKHKRPLVTYRVLDIEPMKKVLRTEGGIEHNGLKKAIHICRGHFKTYTAEKPLFGRVTGTFWWEATVRGSKERGIALKDYRVKAPQPEKGA